MITTGKGVTAPFVDFAAAKEPPGDFHGAQLMSCWCFGCPMYWTMPLSLGLSPRVLSALKEFKPDLIHCCSPGVMVWGGSFFAQLLNVPLVLAYHTHIPEYVGRYGLPGLKSVAWQYIRKLHKPADLTLTVSSVLRRELAAAKVADYDSMEVWLRGVDSEVFHPRYKSAAWRKRLTEGNPDAPLLVHVGRLGPEKNLLALKGILTEVRKGCPEARLAIVGDGPARGELEKALAGTGTYFAGMLKGEDLSAAYASGDAFVMPSESETLGFVVLEGMASGIPVVAARAGGIPDIITRSGENGYLYTPSSKSADSDKEAAAILVRLLQDKELNRRIGEAGRAEVCKYDWRASVTNLLTNQYPKAVERRRAAPEFWLHKIYKAVMAFFAFLAAMVSGTPDPSAPARGAGAA